MKDSELSYHRRDDVERSYRATASEELIKARIVVGESDLWVLSNLPVDLEVKRLLKTLRCQIKEYIHQFPLFQATLAPYPMDQTAPEVVKMMITAAATVGVGPMAAIAGTIAGMIGSQIDSVISELIIENGGDIYLRSTKSRTIAIYAGKSVYSNQIGIKLLPQTEGIGVCTSAGTVGPSLSLGRADAVTIIAHDVALADATATAAANRITSSLDLTSTLEYTQTISGIMGCLLIKDQKIAAWGNFELVSLA